MTLSKCSQFLAVNKHTAKKLLSKGSYGVIQCMRNLPHWVYLVELRSFGSLYDSSAPPRVIALVSVRWGYRNSSPDFSNIVRGVHFHFFSEFPISAFSSLQFSEGRNLQNAGSPYWLVYRFSAVQASKSSPNNSKIRFQNALQSSSNQQWSLPLPVFLGAAF